MPGIVEGNGGHNKEQGYTAACWVKKLTWWYSVLSLQALTYHARATPL